MVSGRYKTTLRLGRKRVKLTCHNCHTLAQKFGWFISGSKRIQRYRCKQCGKTFGDIPQRPLEDLRVPFEKAAQVVHLLCEGVGVRAAARLASVDKHTVLAILETVGRKCARVLDEKVRNLKSQQVECDELYSFVRTRPDNTPEDDEEHGEFFLFLSLDRDSKLIINHLVGKRRGDNARTFLTDLKGRITSRFQLSTDGWLGYTGWNAGVRRVFGDDSIDYGSEVKQFGNVISRVSTNKPVPRRFNPIVCKWVKRMAQIGNPDLSKVNTSRAERLNLSVRLFNRRFTRLTLGYSKKLANHKAAAALFTAFHNFVRVHSAHGQTPAMAAGLTDHKWTVEDLICSQG